jgi:peptide/nickel transport system permease protein
MFVDIFPNLLAPVLVYLTLLIPAAIVFEATLSFLGLGVVPPTPSWGNMLAESLNYYRVAWWFVLVPGVALLVTTLAFNLLGDSIRGRLRPARRAALSGVAMARFLVRRILLGLVVLWVITTLVFIMFFVAPSNVARLIAGRQATPETVALVKHRLGLDRPAIDQYGTYLSNLVHGDLGYSFYNSESVRSLIWQRLPVTLSLAIGAAVIWLVIGVSSGVVAATRPRSLADRVVTGHGAFLLLDACVSPWADLPLLPLLPAPPGRNRSLPGEWLRTADSEPAAVGPASSPALVHDRLVTAALYSRLTRGAMLDVLGEDYIRTARAKGLRERRVVYRHGLRSAVAPVITQFGIDLGTLLGGVIIVENIFGLPDSASSPCSRCTTQDLPVIIGTVVLAAAFIVAANIVVDICYALLDPAVRVN